MKGMRHMSHDSGIRLRRRNLRPVGLLLLLAALALTITAVAGCGSSGTSSSPAPTVTVTAAASPVASPSVTPSAAPTTAAVAEPSATVMALQSDLKAAGYYKGKVTGVYDAGTGAAVKRMELALKVPGANTKYGAQTYTAQKASNQQSLPVAFVKQVQIAMQQLKFYKGSIDGVYGAKTAAAVKAFQASVGLTPDGVAGPKTITAYEAALKGDSSVATLQQELKNLGYYQGAIDGVYGPSTTAAVRTLQVDLGVTPADGRFGPKTAAALDQKQKGKGTATVVQLQSDLTTLGYFQSRIDGVYGPATTQAVKLFQQDHGLAVDGVAGTKTMAAIQKEMGLLGS
jgi:peptidoglycan hydrolase-like protein with peptidoglycan-binding domain